MENLDLSLEKHAAPIRVQWSKANSDAQELFKTSLSDKLNQIILPDCIACNNIHCMEHRDSLEDYTMNVMEAVKSAAKEYLPISGGKSSTLG